MSPCSKYKSKKQRGLCYATNEWSNWGNLKRYSAIGVHKVKEGYKTTKKYLKSPKGKKAIKYVRKFGMHNSAFDTGYSSPISTGKY